MIRVLSIAAALPEMPSSGKQLPEILPSPEGSNPAAMQVVFYLYGTRTLMDSITLYPATEAELPIIARLAREIWPDAYDTILSDAQIRYMLDWLYTPEALARQAAEGQQFYLLSDAGEPIGFFAVGPVQPDVWKLFKLYLLPQHQGKGLGSYMLAQAEQRVQAAGIGTLTLNVNRHNPARHLYTKRGYEIHETRDIPIGEGYFMNDYILSKRLARE